MVCVSSGEKFHSPILGGLDGLKKIMRMKFRVEQAITSIPFEVFARFIYYSIFFFFKNMTDDAFILVGIDDENAKEIAEILKSKSAKKMLQYLSEVKEASQKDMADKLDMPMNTIEYNLKKLIKAGLVGKTSNFFWSVKGKKIPMYKLVKKHIVIGTKKPNMQMLKSFLPVILVIIAIIALIVLAQNYISQDKDQYTNSLQKFNSLAEVRAFLEKNADGNAYGYGGGIFFDNQVRTATSEAMPAKTDAGQSATDDYSTTNIQVEGVDEPDIVKSDGKHLYVVGDNKVFIVDAYPANAMKVLATINSSDNEYISQIFIADNKLVIFAQQYNNYYGGCEGDVCIMEKSMIAPPYYQNTQYTKVYVYDTQDKTNPQEETKVKIEGNFFDSRLINDQLYIVTQKYIDTQNPQPPIYYLNEKRIAGPITDVYYFDYPDYSYQFTSITALNIDTEEVNTKTYLTGTSQALYVSEKNIFLAFQKKPDQNKYATDYIEEVALKLEELPVSEKNKIKNIQDSDDPSYMKISQVTQIIYDYSFSLEGKERENFDKDLEEKTLAFNKKMAKEFEKTIVHRIRIDEGDIDHKAQGEVPGSPLNQFSMDEHEGYFRIATTTGQSWSQTSLNHLYVLDQDLEIVGQIEDLAPGERIYSARFLGDKAYMVTFRQVDPLYAIDLSDSHNPKVLGYLKITGYSAYLHPYDENHIIGIGMEASEEGRVQELKVALFDVTDMENPKLLSSYDLTQSNPNVQSYSYSDALHDHKAFLFNKEKELLVIPVSYNSYDAKNYSTIENWQGAYVFKINLKDGIKLQGKISHNENNQDWQHMIRRTLYISDTLYTVSLQKIRANALATLQQINEIKII